MGLDIHIQAGSVSVSNMNNHTSIVHRDGKVNVNNIKGKVQIRSERGDITVHAVERILRIDSQESFINVQEIHDNVAIRNRNGDIRVHDVEGKVILNTLKGNIELNRIQGALDIDHRDGELICNRFSSGVRIYAYKGDVRLTPQIPIPQAYTIAVDRGDVILRIPENSNVLAEMEVQNGRIQSDYYMPVWADKNFSYTKGAINQGENIVNISVHSGSISLLKDLPGELIRTPATGPLTQPLSSTQPDWETRTGSGSRAPSSDIQSTRPVPQGETEIEPVPLP